MFLLFSQEHKACILILCDVFLYPNLSGVLLIGRAAWEIFLNQSKGITQI